MNYFYLIVYIISNLSSIAMENKTKINNLTEVWPANTLAVQSWLSSQGVSVNLTLWYLKSGWIKALGRGAYARAGDHINWPGGLYAIQRYLNRHIHVGAKSALEIFGRSHYIRMGARESLTLFGGAKEKLPKWFYKNSYWDIQLQYFPTNLFSENQLGITSKEIESVEVLISSPERAIMEVLHIVPQHQSLDECYLLMENLISFRPGVVQELLEKCSSVKVKRLFLYLADRCNHPWLKHLQLERIDLGKGKRVIGGGGVYHSKYQLSLPKYEGDENGSSE